MKEKLTVGVAILLVGIGVTLAYFVGGTVFSNEGATTKGTTAIIQDNELKVEGEMIFGEEGIYPGHKEVAKIKVTAKGDGSLIFYDLYWEGENTFTTPLKFQVYKSPSEIDDGTDCKVVKEIKEGAIEYSEDCKIKGNFEEMVKSGEITTSGEVILTEGEYLTASKEGEVMYFYVVLEYPNSLEQNEEIGSSFKGEVKARESDTEADINIVGMYVNDKKITEIPEGSYILDSKSSCTKGSRPTWSEGVLTVDNLTESGTDCNLYFRSSQ